MNELHFVCEFTLDSIIMLDALLIVANK